MRSPIVTCASTAVLLSCVVAATPARAGLALTAAGAADGFSLSLFASGFPHSINMKGPGGIATTVAGNVLVTGFAGSPVATYSFADADGQTPATALNISNVGTDLFGLTNAGGVVYAVDFKGANVNQTANIDILNSDGSFNSMFLAIGSVNPQGSSITTDPVNQHIYVDSSTGILDMTPSTKNVRTVNTQIGDGITVSPAGTTVYLAHGSAVNGYDTTTGATVFSSGAIFPGIADGVGVIQGSGKFAGDLIVNTNGGIVYLAGPAHQGAD